MFTRSISSILVKRWSALATIATFLLASFLIWFSPLSLSADEAYYWTWSKNLDWAYYSKGGLVALLIRISTSLFGDTQWSVRLPALVFALLTALVYSRFMAEILPGKSMSQLIVPLLFSTPLFLQSAVLMTTDSATLFAWALTILYVTRALQREEARWWYAAFTAMAVGIYAKYTLFLLPSGLLIIFYFHRSSRAHLRTKEFWFALLLLAFLLAPIIYWNANHHWVNFNHNLSHLRSASAGKDLFRRIRLGDFLAGQLGLIGPAFFAVICIALTKAGQLLLRGKADLQTVTLFAFSAPLLCLCLVVSLVRPVYANWPLPSYLAGATLVGHLYHSYLLAPQPTRKALVYSLPVNFFLIALSSLLFLGFTFNLPGHLLPSKKLFGGQELGSWVQTNLKDNWFLVTAEYGDRALIEFYTPGTAGKIICLNLTGRRMNHYDLEEQIIDPAYDDALIVLRGNAHSQLELLTPYFKNIEVLNEGKPLEINYSGDTLQKYYLFLGKHLQRANLAAARKNTFAEGVSY